MPLQKGDVMSRRAPGIAVTALVALSLLTGCGGSGLTATELTAGARPAGNASLEVGDGSRTYDFALDLLRENADGNSALISPLSVLSALAMAENGADGETLAQMERVTGMGADELTNLLQAYGALTDDGLLSVANSIGNEFVKMIFVSFLNSNIYPLKNLPTSRVCIFLETPYSKASSHFPIASHLQ